jgi:hypothetical protein
MHVDDSDGGNRGVAATSGTRVENVRRAAWLRRPAGGGDTHYGVE